MSLKMTIETIALDQDTAPKNRDLLSIGIIIHFLKVQSNPKLICTWKRVYTFNFYSLIETIWNDEFFQQVISNDLTATIPISAGE